MVGQPRLSGGVVAGLAGWAAAGACLTLHGPPGRVLAGAAGTLGSTVMSGALMAPALYVGSALLGGKLGVKEIAGAVLGAMKDGGRLLLCASPVMAFLSLAASSGFGEVAWTFLGLLLAAVLGMRGLSMKVLPSSEMGWLAAPAVWLWCVLTVAMGARLTASLALGM